MQWVANINGNLLVLEGEWQNEYRAYYRQWGIYRDYFEDPLPHSPLSTNKVLVVVATSLPWCRSRGSRAAAGVVVMWRRRRRWWVYLR